MFFHYVAYKTALVQIPWGVHHLIGVYIGLIMNMYSLKSET